MLTLPASGARYASGEDEEEKKTIGHYMHKMIVNLEANILNDSQREETTCLLIIVSNNDNIWPMKKLYFKAQKADIYCRIISFKLTLRTWDSTSTNILAGSEV